MGSHPTLLIEPEAPSSRTQAWQAFGEDADRTKPHAPGATATDTIGAALMGRTFNDVCDTPEATQAASTALPANALRARLHIQNLSDTDPLWFDWGTTAVAGACFKLFPGQDQQFIGDACPADLLSVIADTGKTVAYYAKDW